MFFTNRGFILFGVVALFCVAYTAAAAAEGRLRQMLETRHMEKAESGEEGGLLAKLLTGEGEGKTCEEHKANLDRLLDSRFGKRAFGPAADLQDVTYGAHARNKLDVFYARNRIGNEAAPIIIMVHGGGWCVGDKALKSTIENKIARWLERGFVFVSVNYPMIANGFDGRAQAEEIARAVTYVQNHAVQWNADPAKVILMGHSAGAHLVSLVNADAGIRAKMGVQKVLGTVSIDSGAVDVVVQMPNTIAPLKLRYKEAFGTTQESWMAASPYHQLDASAAPWLGICSTTRPDDICTQTQSYVDKSRSLGVMADILPQKRSHGKLNSELGLDNDYTRAVERFMSQLDAGIKKRLSPE